MQIVKPRKDETKTNKKKDSIYKGSNKKFATFAT